MRSEAAWKQSWAYTFLSWTGDCLQLWQPLGAASFRCSRSHLEHLIITGGADLCLTQHLQKVSHKSWQILGGQRTCTMVLQDSADTGTGNCLDRPASASTFSNWSGHLKDILSSWSGANTTPLFFLNLSCFFVFGLFSFVLVAHNMDFILFNLLEVLASIYNVARMVCTSWQIFFQIAWTFICHFCIDSDNELTRAWYSLCK